MHFCKFAKKIGYTFKLAFASISVFFNKYNNYNSLDVSLSKFSNMGISFSLKCNTTDKGSALI